MNKAELIAAMSEASGLSKKDTEKSLNSFMEVVGKTLEDGDKVQLVGFGSFEPFKRAERTGRNPQTQAPLLIKASTVAKFKTGKQLKDRLN